MRYTSAKKVEVGDTLVFKPWRSRTGAFVVKAIRHKHPDPKARVPLFVGEDFNEYTYLHFKEPTK